MSGLLKVLGGTPNGEKPFLCKTCTNSHYTKGVNNEEKLICNYDSKVEIKHKIIECNDYYSRHDPSLRGMEDIAYILVSKKGGREFGFERLSKLRDEGKTIPGKDYER